MYGKKANSNILRDETLKPLQYFAIIFPISAVFYFSESMKVLCKRLPKKCDLRRTHVFFSTNSLWFYCYFAPRE